MINCQQALNLFRYWLIERMLVDKSTLLDAQTHINQCLICQTKISSLVNQIQNAEQLTIPCEVCQTKLADYYEALQANEPLSDELLPVALHLLDCPNCAEELEVLTEVMAADAVNTLPPLLTKPTFALSFLPTPMIYWHKVDEQVRRLFSDVVIAIRQTTAQFAQMPAPLTPLAVMSGATRSQGWHTPAQLLELPKGESGLKIALQTLPPVEDGATLVVSIKNPADDSTLEHVRVHLYDAEHRLLLGLTSDTAGMAYFRDLTAGRYLLQVRYQKLKEEVPVLIVDET